jgi:hypothetical protein
MARLDEFLTGEEYNILEEIDDELRSLAPPPTIRERLVQLGYVYETMEGYEPPLREECD